MGTVNPLDGMRVVDVTTFLAGPYATRVLADLGAEVIKVEPPGGDPTRGGWIGDGEANPYWQALHRGRKSVVIDLKDDEGKAAFRRLVATADVLVENLRSGVLAGLGLDPASLRAANQRLITCSIIGFVSPELTGAPAVDGAVQAWTGVVGDMEAWTGAALPIPVQIADLAGGTSAVQAVLGALAGRATSGTGCHITVSLEEALTQWLSVCTPISALAAMTEVATGSDGARFVVQAPMHFRARVEAIAGTDVDRWSRAPAAEWLAQLRAAGVPAAPLGARPAPPTVPPWSIDGARNDTLGPPPRLGQHDADLP